MKRRNINYAFYITIAVYVVITLSNLIHHTPWRDEALAWNIAREMDFSNFLYITKVEGHPLVWFLCLVPFAKYNLFYPYSMQIINWIFCTTAIVVMWLKAPFPNITKACITFSFPFLAFYSIVSRCYTIGIMLLFILAAMYKNKLKRPILYTLIVSIAANTSVMAASGAAVFGFLFVLDFIKEKRLCKKLVPPFLVLCSGAFVFLKSLMFRDPNLAGNFDIHFDFNFFKDVFFIENILLNLILLFVFILLLSFFFVKRKKSLFFITFNVIFLIIIFSQYYTGFFWHHYYFFIYLIIAIWLGLIENNEKSKIKTVAIWILSIIAFLSIFNFNKTTWVFYQVYDNFIEKIVTVIKTDKYLSNSSIITPFIWEYSLIPYFSDTNTKIVNYSTGKVYSYDVTVLCRYDKEKKEMFYIGEEVLRKSAQKNSLTFLLMPTKIINNSIEKFDGFTLYKYKCINKELCFWQLREF